MEEIRGTAAAAHRRRRLWLAVGLPSLAVVAVVATMVVVKSATGAGHLKSGQRRAGAASSVITDVTSVPGSVLDQVGAGSAKQHPVRITSPELTAGGKPRVVYVGAEYCPYCAAERWAVVVALARFGTFTDLGQAASSPSDVYPNTATLSFHGAGYQSRYLAFTGKELQSNQVVSGNYAPLDTLSPADSALLAKYDAAPYVPAASAGAIPFIDLGGRYLVSGASYNPSVLRDKTHAQIAAALSNPNSPIAQGADGTANLITAVLCELTGHQPDAVCRSSGVARADAALSG